MKKNYLHILLINFFGFILATSCVSKKDMVYFQNEETIQNEVLRNYAPKIQMDDIISIFVSAQDTEAAAPFNLFQGGSQINANKPITYLVDTQGEISFPIVGQLKVAGLTTNELRTYLKGKLEGYLKNPVVTIRLENFRVSVLGEVKNPGAFNVVSERISIPEAIALAGDLTIQGKRKNVLLIRNINGAIEKIRLDLTNESLFASPYYYLAQNDILYIEPNKAKVNSAAIGTTSSLISIATAVLSLVLILTR
jgi:polysaccharide export outer membrane protein